MKQPQIHRYARYLRRHRRRCCCNWESDQIKKVIIFQFTQFLREQIAKIKFVENFSSFSPKVYLFVRPNDFLYFERTKKKRRPHGIEVCGFLLENAFKTIMCVLELISHQVEMSIALEMVHHHNFRKVSRNSNFTNWLNYWRLYIPSK